ncbi:MAG: fibronectin type III domain-containing protein [Spirochaetes bacterium]|nr:fibronectin type III domain-containing protein [Spirochaetota bacterium]
MEYLTRISIVTVIAVLTGIASGPLYADHVFLKSGAIIEGSIINENTSLITVKTKEGKIVTHNKRNVMRTVYTRLYMGKLHVNLLDGTILECYIVDEDRDTYTVRLDINRPEEFTIKRVDVLFMVRKNPSALAGNVFQKYADLTWKKPYNPVKYYKIYLKTGNGTFKQVGETRSTRYQLKGLNCNMKYTVEVTAIDGNKYESLPSNELTITTKKGRPTPPRHIKIAKITSDKDGVYSALLEWDKARDPCGGIIDDFRIYLKVMEESADKNRRKGAEQTIPETKRIPAGYRLLGNTSADTFQITDLRDSTSYGVLVTSVDNTGDESNPGKGIIFDTGSRQPLYPFPVSCAKRISRDGKKLTASLSWAEVADPFRRIASYRIYRTGAKDPERIGETEKTVYEIPGLPSDKKHTFIVRAVDVRGFESEDSYAASTGLLRYVDISATAGCVMPLRNFGSLYSPGYGVSLSVTLRNLFYSGIALGIESGYAYLSGKTKKSTFTSMVPVKANVIYRWQPARWFSIEPKISLGASYNSSDVSYFMIGSLEYSLFHEYSKKSQAEFLFSCGASFNLIVKKIIFLRLYAEYGGIVEKSTVMDFFTIGGGIGGSF